MLRSNHTYIQKRCGSFMTEVPFSLPESSFGLNQKEFQCKLNIDREGRLIGLSNLVAKEAFSWLGGNSPGYSTASCGPKMLCFILLSVSELEEERAESYHRNEKLWEADGCSLFATERES